MGKLTNSRLPSGAKFQNFPAFPLTEKQAPCSWWTTKPIAGHTHGSTSHLTMQNRSWWQNQVNQDMCFSPHHCVGFLFLALHPVLSSFSSSSSSVASSVYSLSLTHYLSPPSLSSISSSVTLITHTLYHHLSPH